jgi:NAD(P)-dependent dehydrogenase (short-subunit alcohol dehydrogenase family)
MPERLVGKIAIVTGAGEAARVPGSSPIAPYPMVKHGLVGQPLALEYDGVRVSVIAPATSRRRPRSLTRTRSRIRMPKGGGPMTSTRPERRGRPEEVAMTVLFHASDEAPFSIAETIVIDGWAFGAVSRMKRRRLRASCGGKR